MSEKRLEMLEKLIASGSKDPFHHYARALELRGLRRVEDAAAAFDCVARDYPDYVPTYLMAGQLCEERNQLDEARQWYRRGLEKAQAANDGHAQGELQAALDEISV